jgi:hypothetical protein
MLRGCRDMKNRSTTILALKAFAANEEIEYPVKLFDLI